MTPSIRSNGLGDPGHHMPSRGTVLMVGNFAPDEGFAWWLMENFWIELTEIAKPFGLDPLLIYRDPGAVPASIHSAGIETEILPFLVDEGDLVTALRLIRRRRVRVVYLTDRPFADQRYALLRMAGVQRIITHDHVPGDRPPLGGLKGRIKSVYNRLPMLTADRQLVVSPFVEARAVRSGRIPRDRISVVQNGIPEVECKDFRRDYTHRTFGISPDQTICVMVGRAHRYKRVDFFIDVARQVGSSPEGTDVTFLFCGDGPHLDEFRSKVAEFELEERFVFAGRRSDLPAILCSCDLALHPSRGEAFSLAIIEYMGAGLPVLVPNLPSVCQAVEHGLTGYIFPDEEVSAAAHFVLSLHQEPELRERMGESASREARRKYSLSQMNAQFREVMARECAAAL